MTKHLNSKIISIKCSDNRFSDILLGSSLILLSCTL